MQMICALLVFGGPDLPAPLAELSPWLDRTTSPIGEVVARLGAQTHRRIIKTHTPLDGIVVSPVVSYIVVARHPLDVAVSLYHQGDNINRRRLAELTGTAYRPWGDRPPVEQWVRDWIARAAKPVEKLDSLPGVAWHLSDAWRRRHHRNVILVRYEDLLADLPAEMMTLSQRLDLAIGHAEAEDLAEAASFGAMKAKAAELVPDSNGLLKDPRRFFRRGGAGSAEEILDRADIDAYHRRINQLAPPDLVAWLHGTRSNAPVG
jgi:hypothetical protein